MGFSFRKSIKICKGININLSKKGASVSVGPRGAKFNVNSKGVRTTANIGGLRYTKTASFNDKRLRKPYKAMQSQMEFYSPNDEPVKNNEYLRKIYIIAFFSILFLPALIFTIPWMYKIYKNQHIPEVERYEREVAELQERKRLKEEGMEKLIEKAEMLDLLVKGKDYKASNEVVKEISDILSNEDISLQMHNYIDTIKLVKNIVRSEYKNEDFESCIYLVSKLFKGGYTTKEMANILSDSIEKRNKHFTYEELLEFLKTTDDDEVIKDFIR